MNLHYVVIQTRFNIDNFCERIFIWDGEFSAFSLFLTVFPDPNIIEIRASSVRKFFNI